VQVTIKKTISLKLSFTYGITLLENEFSIIKSAISHDTALAKDMRTPLHLPTYQLVNPIGNR
jgi:hypothetical protein